MVGLPSSGPVGLEGAQWEAQPGSSATYLLVYYSTIQLCTNLLFYYSTVYQSSFLLCSLLSTTPSQVYFTIPSVLCQSTVPPIYYAHIYYAIPSLLSHPKSTIPPIYMPLIYYTNPSQYPHAFTLT